MKIILPTLTKTQKIIAGFALATAIAFLVWGCGTAPKSEVKTDSIHTNTIHMDTTLVDTLKK
jgi:hypothetical protein